ncbi:Hsp33 family molecular chaperone HslO [Edwardsiella piscicida]|uniref:Hsp33 family molecular chaperone HslO n=1 Tax=Edwardsiella piscicida TaxID=1263550 RepID=UPI00054CC684|nr:Hsp33 family molecular chaperone HslO [Edwardsiella piscicida]EKS7814480.1 Hsp33 family molecular chaperone HslO [Edwardsiella piscicida]ELM3658807.1 Hsp33 family molecular chaperone HslO [Edwardsiella piscicida]UCQ20901.1 Hsp33 family molecular chaperone HslO [Edwardsiella piscicida]WAM44491.1 Hsp33 family molecular chaperone HslO [Edwardsiella piscicida]
MSHHDQLHRYLFDNLAVRGELVNASATYARILENHDYPAAVRALLGELLVATSLLTATLKFDGDITVQLQGDGPLTLAVINGNHHQEMRGVARLQGDIADGSSLKHMLGNGVMVITITPKEGERYQGVVALEGDTLASCLEAYFMQSEQLPTRLFMFTGEQDGQPAAAGMLLQILPTQPNNVDDLTHLSHLTATVTPQELFTLPANEVLYRLYNQEQVTLFEPQPIAFRCGCSRERSASALMSLPSQQLEELLAERGSIDIHCDYCGSHYLFDRVDIDALRAGAQPSEAGSLH